MYENDFTVFLTFRWKYENGNRTVRNHETVETIVDHKLFDTVCKVNSTHNLSIQSCIRSNTPLCCRCRSHVLLCYRLHQTSKFRLILIHYHCIKIILITILKVHSHQNINMIRSSLLQ